MRIYPALSVAAYRVVEPEGATISGYEVPGGSLVGIPPPSANLSPRNFSDPHAFIPERWIDVTNPKYAYDKRVVVKPFSAGPRNCVGQK